jgi:hypothetical protein
LITLPAGLVALVPGIWMIIDSKGTVRITPMGERGASFAPILTQ